MAINFPDSPTLNQIALVGSSYYIWNGTSWVGYSTSFTVNYNASSIVVQGNGSPLGATTTLNFSTNLTTTYDASGIATVTGSAGGGGSSQWETTAAGIHTLSRVGIGTTNPTSALTVKGNTSLETLSVSGVSTFGGITNVTGATLFTKQLNVSGVSTLGASTVFTTVDNLGNIGIGTNVAINEYSEGNSILSIHGRTWPGNPTLAGSGHLRIYSNKALLGSIYGQDLTGIGFGSSFIIDSSVPMYIGSASTVFINVSGGSVGIATANPMAQLQVDRFGTQTGFGTFSASVGVSTTIDTFTKSFLTAEYTVHIGYGTYIQAQKVLVMNNGSTAYSQEYAIMYEPSQIVSVGATVSGANVLLQVTPQTGVTGLTTYRFVRNSLI